MGKESNTGTHRIKKKQIRERGYWEGGRDGWRAVRTERSREGETERRERKRKRKEGAAGKHQKSQENKAWPIQKGRVGGP